VLTERYNRAAISGLDSPSAIRPSTSSSRSLKGSIKALDWVWEEWGISNSMPCSPKAVNSFEAKLIAAMGALTWRI
jgi:hypothetical protein